MPCKTVVTPFGPLRLTERADAIVRLEWGHAEADGVSPLLTEACAQLRAYAEGRLEAFDLPLRVSGSGLQRTVCAWMSEIPFGETRTYGQIAQALAVGPQAVGQACGGNPIPIIIPCHRVMGASGLTGFSGEGGVETKAALLRHEGALLI